MRGAGPPAGAAPDPGAELLRILRGWRRAVLLFSGGLDSSLLLAAGAQALGPGLTALTVSGPHSAPGELARAVALARRFGVRHRVRLFDPLALPEFRGNTRERCYVCKKGVIALARELAGEVGAEVIWDGTNRDDLTDFRPGLRAAREAGVMSPLLAAGLGKAAIRRLSAAFGLPADRPSQSCLATRFPYDTRFTPADLARVGRLEAWLTLRGFPAVRLRVTGTGVRLELPPDRWADFLVPASQRAFTARLAREGWHSWELAALRPSAA
ncbi:MAG: ATP-dependent sacrificial sulfur transferase LarE [Syntrophobacterales bacterium]|nr:ATP-dependent sacrificial sulfur transferase LarE [Syntrophobacterales bacterium]